VLWNCPVGWEYDLVIVFIGNQEWFKEMHMGAKLTSGGPVRLMCPFGWAIMPTIWPNILLDVSVRVRMGEIDIEIHGL
jgi:hypothetical protein